MGNKKSENNKKGFFVKNKKILLTILTLAIIVTIMGFGVYSNVQAKKNAAIKAQQQNSQIIVNKSALNHPIESDIVFGNPDAPVTIIEYASLSCPHCANFYNDVFSQIKKNYIDDGKVKFIYRDFPLNQSAMLASLIAQCHANNNQRDPEKYYQLIKVMFKTQESWAFGPDFVERLRSLAKLDGMTSSQFDECINNKELSDEILKNRLKASEELAINSTPSFIVNGNAIGGFRDFVSFKKIIDENLK